MDVSRAVNLLTFVWLASLMFHLGISVLIRTVRESTVRRTLLAGGIFGNFVLVPAIAYVLLVFFHPHPLVSAGFIILIVFASAPFGPLIVFLARGDFPLATGFMIVLAALSVSIAPLLVYVLLRLLPESQSIVLSYAIA